MSDEWPLYTRLRWVAKHSRDLAEVILTVAASPKRKLPVGVKPGELRQNGLVFEIQTTDREWSPAAGVAAIKIAPHLEYLIPRCDVDVWGDQALPTGVRELIEEIQDCYTKILWQFNLWVKGDQMEYCFAIEYDPNPDPYERAKPFAVRLRDAALRLNQVLNVEDKTTPAWTGAASGSLPLAPAQIAEITGFSRSAVESKLRRLRNKLGDSCYVTTDNPRKNQIRYLYWNNIVLPHFEKK